jgi:hypothetical protein
MSERRHGMLGLALIALLVSGCASTPAPAASPSPTPTPTPSETAASEPPVLTIGVDGLTLTRDGEQLVAPYGDAASVLELLALVAGPIPAGIPVEPFDGLDPEETRYEWESITVWAGNDGTRSRLRITAGEIEGTIIVATGGIGVGSSRADALAAGGFDDYDSDGDGVPETMGIDDRVVADTQSLSRPGEAGREYVSLGLEGETVDSISAPDNDFGDI